MLVGVLSREQLEVLHQVPQHAGEIERALAPDEASLAGLGDEQRLVDDMGEPEQLLLDALGQVRVDAAL